MGVLFTLTTAIKSVTQQALDDLLNELGKPCLLIYPPIMVPCSCAGATWLTGGPASINNICPLCNGTNLVAQQVTETINMGIVTNPKEFYKPFPINVQVPAGTIQSKCFMAEAIKVRQAREMQVGPSIDGFSRPRYQLDSEPEDVSSIIQSRYFVSTWKRIQ